MTCEENLVAQAELIKANNPLGKAQKVWVYRNTVIAYPWMASMRRIMDDSDYDIWFLKFKNGSDGKSAIHHDRDGTFKNPVCDRNFEPPKCTNLWHSLTQTPGYPHGDGNCDKPCDCGRLVKALRTHELTVCMASPIFPESNLSAGLLTGLTVPLKFPNVAGCHAASTCSISGSGTHQSRD